MIREYLLKGLDDPTAGTECVEIFSTAGYD